MTLDEAIKHAEEVAEKNERRAESVRNRPISSADFYHEEESCSKCADEHRQLAKWLIELKQYKDASNHPETVTEFADRCRECGAKYGKLLKQQPCTDAISRQALIDALVNATDIAERCGTVDKEESKRYLSEFIRWIKGLPPVTPQQKVGHWIDDKCSVCGKGTEDLIASPEWYKDEEPNFCPFCGVKLLKPQAESEEI